jgi:hypothetical protein
MNQFWVQLAEVARNWATVLGIVVTGAWAYYRFGLRREKEAALGIELAYSCVPYNEGHHLVWFDVTLSNKGGIRVVAKRKLRPAYRDNSETLAYSGDLLLRAVPTDVPGGAQVRWFPSPDAKSPVQSDVEADLLDEYARDEDTDFWMEPSENYHIGTAIVLAPGNYLAMITFVGAREGEFWRRIFLVQVPGASSALASGTPVKAA